MWSDWAKRNLIALDMAIEKINASGGVNGMPLKPVIYDTASKPTEAARIVRKLAEDDKVLAILGPFSSSECEVAFPVGKRINREWPYAIDPMPFATRWMRRGWLFLP
jgi:branched-chain amino acid transport system substrate-binding protein